MRAPTIYAERPEQGLVLIEDFGSDRIATARRNAH
jgi:aminoglycoside/choline kinase family phosphotransferase